MTSKEPKFVQPKQGQQLFAARIPAKRCEAHYLDWCERYGKLHLPGDLAAAVIGFFTTVYPDWCAERGLKPLAPPS